MRDSPSSTRAPGSRFGRALLVLMPVALVGAQSLAAQRPASVGAGQYFPPAGDRWERRSPAQVGLDSMKLAAAISFAIEKEATTPRDRELAHYQSFGREPFGVATGPFAERGPATGIILRHGYIVAEWGEPERVDMTFSVTKSFLSATVGVAVDSGLIGSVRDTVRPYVAPIVVVGEGQHSRRAEQMGTPEMLRPFESPHNRTITWDDLLRQTSSWQGTLWGKPDWADRPTGPPAGWTTHPPAPAGTVYEYNDVRVNVLALAAMSVWRRPLPQVLKEHIMDPIGASNSWRWYGYDDSWILLDGLAVQSVSGGGHWGGGMFINARDMARFGYLTLRRGRWNGRQLLSEEWVSMALTPTASQPTYGFMNWFLNTDRKLWPSAPSTSFGHVGNGTNLIYVDPENDLVVVTRWIENSEVDGLLSRVLAAVTPRR